MPKSIHLENVYIRGDDYFYLTFKSNTTFKKGQEDEFIEAVEELRDYYKRNNGHMNSTVDETLEYIMGRSTLNWNKIWEKTNIGEYCGPLAQYIRNLLKYIDWKSFKDKVNQSNDYVIVHRLYYLFCYENEIKDEKEHAAYEEYLTTFFKRTKKTPEGILVKMINDFENSFERGHGVDTTESYIYKSKYEVFKILIHLANLDTIIQYDKQKVSLKNLLFFRILKRGYLNNSDNREEKPSFEIDNKESLKVLFNACDDLVFSGEPLDSSSKDYGSFEYYDRATLTYMMKDIEGALELFDKEEYPLYDQNQLNSLLETGVCSTNNSPFIDRFATMLKFICINNPKAVMKNGATRPEFMDFIYSSKIRVISYATLMIIKNYLNEREFNAYLAHINDEGIHLYFGDYLGLRNSDVSTNLPANDSVTNSILDPNYKDKLEAAINNYGTDSIIDPTYQSRLEATIESHIQNTNPLSNTIPAVITFEYALDNDLDFMDKAKLDDILKELHKHRNGAAYLKSTIILY